MFKCALGVMVTIMAIGSGCSSYGAENEGQLFAGTAKVEITPPVGIMMCGYGDVLAEGIHDPLFARVLVLKDGHTSLAIVSSDLVYLWSPRIISEAKDKWGMDHVILNGSHTHGGPTYEPTEWYPKMEDNIIAAIGEAASDLFPARIGAGAGPVDGKWFGYNRRVVEDNGKAHMWWSNPERKENGPIDPMVRVIRVDDETGKTRALMVHYACHPVTLGSNNRLISADFPGAMATHMEKELGDDVTAMFLQGAGGDIHPFMACLDGDDHGFEMVKENGVSLGKSALSVAEAIATEDVPASIKVKESVLQVAHRQDASKMTDVGVMAVVINNDIAMGVITYEPFVQHQFDLTAKSPVKNTLLLGYSFFGQGTTLDTYLPTIQATKEGGYGAALGSNNLFEVGAGEKMVEKAAQSIRELAVTSADTTSDTSPGN